MLVQYNPQSKYTIYHNARQTPCLYSTTHKSEYTIYHSAKQTPCLYSTTHKSEYTIYHNARQTPCLYSTTHRVSAQFTTALDKHHTYTVQPAKWVHNLPQC